MGEILNDNKSIWELTNETLLQHMMELSVDEVDSDIAIRQYQKCGVPLSKKLLKLLPNF